ncbi:hypothetical protein [Budvicia aquatica]|uniref:CDI immunity protein domain-containing protein n=1 Tax=Budvicia aquatica TaxID=82979 RepID=A0A484ZJC6_9GAMM|nr:hypothetical protein [Budvicia aquatica]VFS48582.1 Uncharacterised protein [Budvicia aquatica]
MKSKIIFINNDGRDLYDIVHQVLSLDKMSYTSFLKMASEGYGCSPSEGCGYALDQNWDDPEEFDEVSFMFGDYESSTISPQHFAELMQVISDGYINANPKDKASIEHYMGKLRERYS